MAFVLFFVNRLSLETIGRTKSAIISFNLEKPNKHQYLHRESLRTRSRKLDQSLNPRHLVNASTVRETRPQQERVGVTELPPVSINILPISEK